MKKAVWKLSKLTPRLSVFLLALLLLAPQALAAPDKPEITLTHSGDSDRVTLECVAKMDAPEEESHVKMILTLQADTRLTLEPSSVQIIYQTEDGESMTLDQDDWDADWGEGILVITLEADTDMGGQLQCRVKGQIPADFQKKLTNTARLDVSYEDLETGERTSLNNTVRDEIQVQRKVSYSLSLDLNGGSLPGKSGTFVWQDDLSQGQQVNLDSLPEPTRTGYFFGGWTLASGTGAKIDKDTLTVGSGDVTLRAAWTSKEDKLTLDLNGGSGRQVTVSGLTGEDVTVPFPSEVLYSRDGYKLAGWSTTPDGQNGKTYTGGEPFTLTREDDVLYALWAPQYSLVYDGNGGTGQMPRRVFSASEEAVISDNVFTRTGYDFIGWCLSADGRGTLYQGGDTITLTGDTVLYAQWEKVYDTPVEENDSHLPLLLGILAALVVICVCLFLLWKRRNDDDGPYDDGGYDGFDDGYGDDYDDRDDRHDGYRDGRSRDRYYDREDRYREDRYRDRDDRYRDRSGYSEDRRRDRDPRRRYDDRYGDRYDD